MEQKEEITLTESKVNFSISKKLIIKFYIEDLDIDTTKIVEEIKKNKDTRISIDTSNIYILNRDKKYLNYQVDKNFSIIDEILLSKNVKDISLIYNIDQKYKNDSGIGFWEHENHGFSVKRMCITSSNKFGFIVTPIMEKQRTILVDCYKAVKNGIFKSYLDLEDERFIYLVIEWND